MNISKKCVRGIAIALSSIMLLAGCGDSKVSNSNNSNIDLSKYPIQTDEKLTMWRTLPTSLSTVVDTMAETEYYKEYAKRTGVEVEFIHPAAGQTVQSFNLMVASDTLPDMIAYTWSWYNGGVQAALEDKIITSLNDYINDYAPNLKNYLSNNPDDDRSVKTDEGVYPYFPLILDGDELTVTAGPAIRKDLLDKYNLEMPETIDDWTNVLRTFKNNGIQIPMSFNYNQMYIFYNMFSATDNFYRDENDKIQLGLVDESYKNALIGIKKWYDEGLLDKNIVSVDKKMIDSYILNGKTGATITSGGSGIGSYMDAAPSDDFSLVGAMYPVKERGTASKYTNLLQRHSGAGVAVTTSCKNPALAAKYLDYVYSDEGRMFSNFGVEGVSYEMVEGYPTYTDMIMKNAEGNSVSHMLSFYTAANAGTSIIQDVRYIEQFYSKPEQKMATEQWTKGAKVAREEFAVPYTVLTAEEGAEAATILNDIVTYAKGMSVKFFTGVEPIEKFDEYVAKIKELGLERLLEIHNDAYDRYKNR